MGLSLFRRVGTAERFVSLLVLVTGAPLVAALPAAADEPPSPTDPAHTEAPPAHPAAPEPDPPVHPVGEVTVTATRAERDVLDVAGNVTVIDREEIDRAGQATVPDLLRRIPGLFVTSTTTNPAGVQVEARGINNGGSLGSSMLVQIDGRRANEADTSNTDWALMPLDRIESIEIVRGPTSVVYGDNAIGGVINIQTRPREGPPRATLRGLGGRYATGGGSLGAAGSLGSFTGSLFVEGFRTDGYRDQSEFSRTDAEGSAEWNLGDRLLLGARGGYHEDFRQLPGALTQEEIDTLGRRASDPDNDGNESDVERGFVDGWIEAVVAEEMELKFQPFFRDRSDVTTISSMVFGDTSIDTDKRSWGLDSHFQIDRPLFERPNRFIAGVDYLHDEADRLVDSSFSTNLSDTTRDVVGIFVQEEIHVLDALLLTAGIRYDHAEYDLAIADPDTTDTASDDPSYGVWSPRVSLTYRFRPTLSAYASYSRGFRFPALDEAAPLLGFPPGSPPLVPGLKPQTSDAGEIGLKLRTSRVDGYLALYLMSVHDEILFDPITFQNTNLDRVRHRGIETALGLQALEWLRLYANYTFDDVEIREAAVPALEGARMPITPKHRGSFGLFATLPYHLEFTANVNVIDDRILANDFDRQLAPLDAYTVFDLLLAWRPRFGEHWSGALSFAMRNVANEEYNDYGARFDLFDLDSEEFVPTAFFNPAVGRTWEVGFALTYRR
jgi:iron complex outermembrane receptor protein